nr:MAG TPA: hypothetical protein [Caudoviricetes sp.]
MSEAEQLEKLCQPVVDWLKKNHDPHIRGAHIRGAY